jgi:AmmeMemoRadiSam system protein B
MLAALRHDLDILPSPSREQPGILIRDPMRYSDAMIVVPWAFARCLDLFDGDHSELDLREALIREIGAADAGPLLIQLIAALRDNAFLEDEVFAAARDRRHREFAASATRPAAHAGSGYPDDREELDATMRAYIDPADLDSDSAKITAIAAPHVSPFGGWECYRAAYRKLPRDAAGRTFIILGTSHYGPMDLFGLTRKRFETPLGLTQPDLGIIDRLSARAAAGITPEDYYHSVEHSIEFQVLFLQWLYGPEIRIVPILCGSFARSIYYGGKPEATDGVHRFFEELSEIADREKDRLTWVLGVDMAHIGKRYGDAAAAHANQGRMAEVAERDHARNARIIAGDAGGFWDLVQQNRDDLRWCGSSPFYTFLKTNPHLRGAVERYEQWNIDESSVVSFAGMSFAPAACT